MRVTSIQYNIYCVCSRIGQQKKLVMSRCVSFVDRLLAAFCCNLRSSCREAGSQSSCASSHRKLVDKAVNASLREGTGGSSAMSSSSSSSSSQSGKVTVTLRLHYVTLGVRYRRFPAVKFLHQQRWLRPLLQPFENFLFTVQRQNCMPAFFFLHTPFTIDCYLPCIYCNKFYQCTRGCKSMLF